VRWMTWRAISSRPNRSLIFAAAAAAPMTSDESHRSTTIH